MDWLNRQSIGRQEAGVSAEALAEAEYNSVVGFVDIHSHILYGLDDGAKVREESVEMLEMAAGCGTTDIVATPHANSHYAFRPVLVAERIADLAAAAPVQIYPGCDFHLQFDNIQDALTDPEKYTLN